jgi:hypothetical protein
VASYGSAVLYASVLQGPKPAVACWFGSLELEFLLPFIDISTISSQKTPGGRGRHWDPMFAKLSASSLLAQLICGNSHPSKVPSK